MEDARQRPPANHVLIEVRVGAIGRPQDAPVARPCSARSSVSQTPTVTG
jgi:hypothetical protein